jgi:hypothetical protein
LVFGFIILSVIYVCLSFYSRAARREKLEKEWQDGHQDMTQDAFVKQGLSEYDGSLRRKLILGVYVVPLCVVTFIIYVTNFA